MKAILTIAAILAGSAAYATDDRVSGHFKGSTKTYAGSSSFNGGSGSSVSEAGQFAASRNTLKFDGAYGMSHPGRDGISVDQTSESYVDGFDRQRLHGDARGFTYRSGQAAASGSHWGAGFDRW